MQFLTAQQAREIVDFVREHNGSYVLRNLQSGLERINEAAMSGKNHLVFQGYGPDVDLDKLVVGFEKLGYRVEDVSSKPSRPGGGPWMARSIEVSW